MKLLTGKADGKATFKDYNWHFMGQFIYGGTWSSQKTNKLTNSLLISTGCSIEEEIFEWQIWQQLPLQPFNNCNPWKSHLVMHWRVRGEYHLLNCTSTESIKLFAWQCLGYNEKEEKLIAPHLLPHLNITYYKSSFWKVCGTLTEKDLIDN